jgi:hypothetical protein
LQLWEGLTSQMAGRPLPQLQSIAPPIALISVAAYAAPTRRKCSSAAAYACLQQGAQFVLVGFVQTAVTVLGLQFFDALFHRLLFQLHHGIQ